MSDFSPDKFAKAVEAIYEIFEKVVENHDEILDAIDKLLILERRGVFDEIVKFSEFRIPLSHEEVEEITEKFEQLLKILLSVDERVLKVIKRFIDAFEESMVYEQMSIVEAMRALRDPDVQKAIGFALTLAKKFWEEDLAECKDGSNLVYCVPCCFNHGIVIDESVQHTFVPDSACLNTSLSQHVSKDLRLIP